MWHFSTFLTVRPISLKKSFKFLKAIIYLLVCLLAIFIEYLKMNNSTSSQAGQFAANLCNDIEAVLLHSPFSILIYFQLLILSIALAAIGILVRQYFKQRILMHGNLLFLFANILLVLFVYTFCQFIYLLRYLMILLFFYNGDPCHLLTPIWMVSIFYGPAYVQTVAYPLLHFCVMLERVRATLMAERYEREGQRLGIRMAIVIWLISFGYAFFVIFSAFRQSDMAIQGVIYLTSKNASLLIVCVSYFALFMVILTALGDWRITKLNREAMRSSSNTIAYSLSRNYQLNENALAMRLILPLDTAYAIIYAIFTVLVIINRQLYASGLIDSIQYTSYYAFINSLSYLYVAISMIVYIRFVHFVGQSQRRSVGQMKASETEAKIYFRQLDQLWK